MASCFCLMNVGSIFSSLSGMLMYFIKFLLLFMIEAFHNFFMFKGGRLKIRLGALSVHVGRRGL